jgi:hypothetical protein
MVMDKKKQRGAGVAAVFAKQSVAAAPGEQSSMTASSHDSVPVSQHAVNPVDKQKPTKATYYVDPMLIKSLKFLSVETDKDLSALVNEAIKDLLAKHKGLSS